MFNTLDWIIVGVAGFLFVVGLIKGLLKQVFSFLGVVVVFTCGSMLTPYAQGWLEGVIPDASLRSMVAMIASYLVLFIAWALITGLIVKLLSKIKAVSFLDRLLGGVLGVATAYVIFAVVFALVLNTADGFLPNIKNLLNPLIGGDSPSWFGANLFSAENNKLGEWIIRAITEKLSEIVPDKETALVLTCIM